MKLGDMERLPDGTLVVVVRAKQGISPARALAHAERARLNLERFEREKSEDRLLGDDAVTVRFRSPVWPRIPL